MSPRLSPVETRLSPVETRLSPVETRLSPVETRLSPVAPANFLGIVPRSQLPSVPGGDKYGKDNAPPSRKFFKNAGIIGLPQPVESERMAGNCAPDDF